MCSSRQQLACWMGSHHICSHLGTAGGTEGLSLQPEPPAPTGAVPPRPPPRKQRLLVAHHQPQTRCPRRRRTVSLWTDTVCVQYLSRATPAPLNSMKREPKHRKR